MFNIGFGELIIIFIVALIVLGPRRLPEAARSIAKVYKEVMGVVNEVKTTVNEPIKDIPKNYLNTPLDDDFKTAEKKEQEKIDIENYQPKREKISFKKKVEEQDGRKETA
jgi:Tat protein translocase TatB subunit